MNDMIKLIQHTRLKKGYNFYDIEEATGIPTKKMHSFEKGLVQLSVEEIDRLFKFLDLQQGNASKNRKPRKMQRRFIFTGITTLVLVSILLFLILPALMNETDLIEPADNTPTDSTLESTNNLDSAETTHEPEQTLPESEKVSGSGDEAITPVVSDSNSSVQLRFWGNMPYQTEELPALSDQNASSVFEVFTIEGLYQKDEIPKWLTGKDIDQTLLNFATRLIWSEVKKEEFELVKERDRLNKIGYHNIGLDYRSEVTKPYILETPEGKVGILPFTRHVLHAEHLAEKNEVGLARAPDIKTIAPMIQAAKKEVDFLIVLIGWGDRDGLSPDSKQKELAKGIAAAGADFIIGNHAVYGQEVEWIDDVPIFYSLGHSISKQAKPGAYSFVLDVALENNKISDIRIHVGKFVNGKLTFDLSDEEKSAIQQNILTPQALKSIKVE